MQTVSGNYFFIISFSKFYMTKLLFVFFLIMCGVDSFGQLQTIPVPKTPPTFEQGIRDAENQSCLHKIKIPTKTRLKIFPFDESFKVQLVSFQQIESTGFDDSL